MTRLARSFLDSGPWTAFNSHAGQVCSICLNSQYHLKVFVIVPDEEVNLYWKTEDNKQDGNVTTSEAGLSATIDAMETV